MPFVEDDVLVTILGEAPGATRPIPVDEKEAAQGQDGSGAHRFRRTPESAERSLPLDRSAKRDRNRTTKMTHEQLCELCIITFV